MSGIDDENAVGPLGEVVVAHIGGEIGVGAGGYGVGDEFAACTAAYSYAAYSKAGDGSCAPKHLGTASLLYARGKFVD